MGWNTESLLEAGIEYSLNEKRWPLCSTSPVPESTIRRHFGSWGVYKERLRTAFVERHGIPDWDRPVTRNTPLAQAVTNTIGEVLESAMMQLNALSPLAPKKPKSGVVAKDDPSELHLVISDVHIGELTLPSSTAGIAEYNFARFMKCADVLEERVLFFRKMYGKAFPINKLVINFIGDIVTGESIFVGQQLQIDRIITEQIFEGAFRFASMFRNWAPEFEGVEIVCIPGNHGRCGKKGELSYLANFDYIASRVIAILCRDIQNMKFIISEGPSLVIRHGDYNFLIHHGDSIPGSGGTKGNFISLERKMEKFSSMMDLSIHYSVSGHQHTSASVARNGMRRIIQNGAWPGGSEFSVEVLGAASIPSQKLLLFHPRKGVFAETDILLGNRKEFAEDENRVYTGNYRTQG